ncbi:MAG: efflux RND transporter periplasmic adaptor subunit [Acidobacteria bacterium]|nr:MAG: efflux RND transporter periplasmic adaptor subunit [Acidobacteriota bacterium]
MSAKKEALEQLRIDRNGEEDSPRRGWIVALVVAALVVAAVIWLLTGQDEIASVRTAVAREIRVGAGSTVLNASGYVTARRQATVSSKITGKVVEVLIEEGMVVAEGQVLARLDDSNVTVSLRLAEAQLESAESSLAETDVLLTEARLNQRRIENLGDQGISSDAELDRARAEADSLAARLERQREEVEVAARQVAVWQQQLEDMVIRAPFAGVVVAKNAQPGEMISPISAGGGFTRTGIGTIVDMSSLEIEVDVNEAYINRVSAGQKVEARLDSYPDWPIPCHVIAIIPTADRQRATVTVRVGFEELDPRILPDMGVKVAFQESLTEEGPSSAVVLPKAAVRREGDREVVLVVAEGEVERRAVTIGESRGEEVYVSSGITAGEKVVITGPADLADGDRVEEIEP